MSQFRPGDCELPPVAARLARTGAIRTRNHDFATIQSRSSRARATAAAIVTAKESRVGELSPAHLIFVLVIAVLVLGPGKLPETGAALGRAFRDFRNAMNGRDEELPPTQGPS